MILLGILVLFIGGFIFLRLQKENRILTLELSPSPTETPSDQTENPEKDLLFDHGDFSFTYPNYQKYYQVGEHAFFWNGHPLPESNDDPTMILQWSDQPFPEIINGKQFTYQTPSVYRPEIQSFTVTNIEKEEVPFGTNKTILYSLTCGVDCYYHVVTFQSSGKYYEFVIYGSGGGIRLWVDKLLASFKLYNKGDKKVYTNTNGNYSLTYDSSQELYEDVGFSVDGVRYSAPDSITFTPGTSLSFKKLEKSLTIEQYVDENEKCDTIYKRTTGSVAGEKAILQEDACGVVGGSTISFIHNGTVYQLSNGLGTSVTFTDSLIKGFHFLD